jgi:hypothetical protein
MRGHLNRLCARTPFIRLAAVVGAGTPDADRFTDKRNQPEKDTAAAKVEKSRLAPVEVIAIHTPMAAAYRGNPRVDYAAVAHCDRLVAKARAELGKNF